MEIEDEIDRIHQLIDLLEEYKRLYDGLNKSFWEKIVFFISGKKGGDIMSELNIIISKDTTDYENISKIFLNNESYEIKPYSYTMLDVLVKIGVFRSKSQARKNYRKEFEIPFGYSEYQLGKKKHMVYIYKEEI